MIWEGLYHYGVPALSGLSIILGALLLSGFRDYVGEILK